MPDFRVFELEERHLALAYPLARSASAVSEAGWHAFARETIAAGGGVLGIEAEDHCLYGLASLHDFGGVAVDAVGFFLRKTVPVGDHHFAAPQILHAVNGHKLPGSVE